MNWTQPIVFSHGWPLSSDDWDAQLMYFRLRGYRVIAHDRRGHGRSAQVDDGHDMDHYADDLAALTEYLDLRDAIPVGQPAGRGAVRGDYRELVMHGDDDQIVPYADSGPLTAALLKNGTLKTYPGFPHGMPTTKADVSNADLLAFIEG